MFETLKGLKIPFRTLSRVSRVHTLSVVVAGGASFQSESKEKTLLRPAGI